MQKEEDLMEVMHKEHTNILNVSTTDKVNSFVPSLSLHLVSSPINPISRATQMLGHPNGNIEESLGSQNHQEIKRWYGASWVRQLAPWYHNYYQQCAERHQRPIIDALLVLHTQKNSNKHGLGWQPNHEMAHYKDDIVVTITTFVCTNAPLGVPSVGDESTQSHHWSTLQAAT